MTFQIKKATKQQAKLRLAIFGPSGSGKTMTSLRLATGLGGGIGVIDTERGSASKYSDRYDFDVIELEGRKDIATVTSAITAFAEHGARILIIDSLSHAWQELLVEIDRLAKTRFKGNTWSAWSEGTPLQRSLVDAILDYPGHVIATMRSKTEWATEQGNNGKSKPIRIGLAPEQGKGIEYEFDMLMEISTSHVAEVIKDRTGRYQDVMIDKPGEGMGRELAAWLSEGEPAPERPATAPEVKPEPPTPETPREARSEAPAAPANDLITPAQLKKLQITLKEQELDGAKVKKILGWLFGRELHSSKDLTKGEASRVLGWTSEHWEKVQEDYQAAIEGGPPEEES